MTNEEIIRAVEGHCRDGLTEAMNNLTGPVTRVRYLAKTLESILWECGRRDADPVPLEIVDPSEAYQPSSPHWGSMVCPAAQRVER